MTDQHTWIEHPDQLPGLAMAMLAAPWIAIDTESNSMFAYRERVCLLQVNARGRIFLVDTLALPPGPGAIEPLRTALEGATRTCWIHGGEYDVICMKRDYRIALGGLFDTQQAASLLGWERTGYGAVVERLLGVELPKGHAQYDWATRPLDPDALRYAVDDVLHLPRVGEAMRAAIADADLEEELAIANRAVMDSGGGAQEFDPAGFWRLKGVRDVPRPSMPILVALWSWRDAAGRAANLPPGRILANEALLATAREIPVSFGQLRKLGLRSGFVGRYGQSLIDVVKAAREQPPEVPPGPRGREVDEAERLREVRLKDWRRSEAERRGVTLQVVLPAKALEFLKQHGAGDLEAVPQLGRKRIGLYGDKLRALCSG